MYPEAEMGPAPLPAPSTKHLDTLDQPIPRSDVTLHLSQISSSPSGTTGSRSSGTTGTTLWLGAQVMACYLADILSASSSPSISLNSPSSSSTGGGVQQGQRRVLELGAGVGYLSLCLAYWGYEVVASDIEPVLSSVLVPNLDAHLGKASFWDRGSVRAEMWDWVDIASLGELPSASSSASSGVNKTEELEGEGYEFIVTTDTLYAPSLVLPLWTTLALVSRAQASPPPVYIALENRDPSLIQTALDQGRNLGFELKRIAARRVEKAVNAAKWGWTREDWDGIEIWKARYKPDGGVVRMDNAL